MYREIFLLYLIRGDFVPVLDQKLWDFLPFLNHWREIFLLYLTRGDFLPVLNQYSEIFFLNCITGGRFSLTASSEYLHKVQKITTANFQINLQKAKNYELKVIFGQGKVFPSKILIFSNFKRTVSCQSFPWR